MKQHLKLLAATLALGITAVTSLGYGGDDFGAGCAAPCTESYGPDFYGCWFTKVWTTSPDINYPIVRETAVLGICNGNMQCSGTPPTPVTPPPKTTTISHEKVSTQKYTLSGTAKWQVFGLTASAASEVTETWKQEGVYSLTGWCQRIQLDIAKTHVRKTANWTFTYSNSFWCWGTVTPTSGTVTLDQYSLYPRSDDDVQPYLCNLPDPCCRSCPGQCTPPS